MDWKGSADAGKAVTTDINTKKKEIAAELRAAYNIKPSITDDQIFSEYVRQNKDSGMLDQLF